MKDNIVLYEAVIESMKSWKWRLKRARINQAEVGKVLNLTANHSSRILNLRADAKISHFIAIEKMLVEAEQKLER